MTDWLAENLSNLVNGMSGGYQRDERSFLLGLLAVGVISLAALMTLRQLKHHSAHPQNVTPPIKTFRNSFSPEDKKVRARVTREIWLNRLSVLLGLALGIWLSLPAGSPVNAAALLDEQPKRWEVPVVAAGYGDILQELDGWIVFNFRVWPERVNNADIITGYHRCINYYRTEIGWWPVPDDWKLERIARERALMRAGYPYDHDLARLCDGCTEVVAYEYFDSVCKSLIGKDSYTRMGVGMVGYYGVKAGELARTVVVVFSP